MTGAIDSIIGVKTEICVKRSLTQIPYKMETAEGEAFMSGALFHIDPSTMACVGIERFNLRTD